MKKSLLLFSLFSFIFALWITFAYSAEDTSNANYLADQGIVTKQSTTSKYRLDDKILRQEVIGMALKVKGITLPENYTCKKYFTDATKNDWVCRAVEMAADNGIITRSNKNANPGKYVTRAEALAMMMKAGGLNPEDLPAGGVVSTDATVVWQIWIIDAASKFGILDKDDYTMVKIDYSGEMMNDTQMVFSPNRLATRAEVFGFTKNILTSPDVYSWFNTDKTYISDRYHYSIKYPENWYIDTQWSEDDYTQRGPDNELIGGDTIFSNYPINKYNMDTGFPEDYFVLSFHIYKAWVATTLDDFITQKEFDYDTKELITLNWMSAVILTNIATDHPVWAYWITVLSKFRERVYTFSYGDISGNKNNKNFIIADKIIKSISF